MIWLRLPDSWPTPVVAGIALILLTALDLCGSALAKEAVEHRSVSLAATGAAVFVLMFWVFASSLHVADLSAVSIGWCVLVTVGVLALDRIRYGVHLTTGKTVAVVVALIALTYLLAGPSGRAAAHAAAGSRVRLVVAQLLSPSRGQTSPLLPRHRLGVVTSGLQQGEASWPQLVRTTSRHPSDSLAGLPRHQRGLEVLSAALEQTPLLRAPAPPSPAGDDPRPAAVTVAVDPAQQYVSVRVLR